MQSFIFVSALVASLVAAAPTWKSEKRQTDAVNGTVVMCTLPNWKGECQTLTVPLLYGSCTTLVAPFAYNVSAFEPVYGTVCWLRKTTDCVSRCQSPSGCNEIVEFPGRSDLSTYGNWTDNFGSFTCEADDYVPSK